MKTVSLVLAGAGPFGAAILLSSCMSADVGRSFEPTKVARLEVGATTKAQVIEWFGPPFVSIETARWQHPRMHFGDETTVLILRHVHGHANLVHSAARCLQTEFDSTGLLVDYYFTSSFHKDGSPTAGKEANFDIFLAKTQVVAGKTTRAEVCSLLGSNYLVLPFKKPGVAQRWYYGYSEQSKTQKNTFHGKSVEVDFGADGTVQHVRGESDFPEDASRR